MYKMRFWTVGIVMAIFQNFLLFFLYGTFQKRNVTIPTVQDTGKINWLQYTHFGRYGQLANATPPKSKVLLHNHYKKETMTIDNIQQIIPLPTRTAQYGKNVIALALVIQGGKMRLLYVAHDPVSGGPVLQENNLTHHQTKGGSHARS